MDNEAEMIEEKMKETREGLTQKLEQLEQQVVETVQNTTSAVSDTVESVKEVVEGTVESVQNAVEETTEAVKKTFDLRLQVENHPWLMLGGSVAVGFVAGRLLEGLMPPARATVRDALPPPSSGGVQTDGGRAYWYSDETAPRREATPPAKSASSENGWFDALTRQFAPQIDQLKSVAIGTVVGLVRDMVKQSLPQELGGRLSEMLDDVTKKAGGEPFRGPVVPEEGGSETSPRQGYSRSQPQPSGSSSGRGQTGAPPFNRI
jgi:ElaB/YqjD/DUF883 family membrane-anchored ribosome-binding protein